MLPKLKTSVPGPRSRALMRRLRRVECAQITFADRHGPVFVRSAFGTNVVDADGNRLLDLSAFFSVSGLGHANPKIARAMRKQINRGWHGMGDVHPPVAKLECAERLASVLPAGLSHMIFSSSGSEAVESALKTAFLATGKPGVIAFDGAYHGLGYGAMQVTHRKFFREPFNRQAKSFATFADYVTEGASLADVATALRRIRTLIHKKNVGAVLIEAVQGRGGVRVADRHFLAGLRRITRQEKALLIFDEIFTGFGRTGRWFAFQHTGVMPDLVTLGKCMSSGFPISACAGTARVMNAWGPSRGEAKHTSTFLGNPLGCAMTIATLDEMKRGRWPDRARRTGRILGEELKRLATDFPGLIKEARGKGMMRGIEMRKSADARRLIREALKSGIIVLGSGEHGQIVELTPPFTLSRAEITFVSATLRRILQSLRS